MRPLLQNDWCLLKKEKLQTEVISESDLQHANFKKPNTVAHDEAETDPWGSLNSWASLPAELQAGKRIWLEKQKGRWCDINYGLTL